MWWLGWGMSHSSKICVYNWGGHFEYIPKKLLKIIRCIMLKIIIIYNSVKCK